MQVPSLPPPPAFIEAASDELVPVSAGVVQPTGSALVENPITGSLYYLLGGASPSGCARIASSCCAGSNELKGTALHRCSSS